MVNESEPTGDCSSTQPSVEKKEGSADKSSGKASGECCSQSARSAFGVNSSDKSACPPPKSLKKVKPGCHSSREQFKQKTKNDCCESDKASQNDKSKCHSTSAAFMKSNKVRYEGKTDNLSQKRDCTRESFMKSSKEKFQGTARNVLKNNKKKCHSSREAFTKKIEKSPCDKPEKTEEKCYEPREVFMKQIKASPCCDEPEKTEDKCYESHKTFSKIEDQSYDKCPGETAIEPKNKQSSSPLNTLSAAEDKTCHSTYENLKESSIYSKIGEYCKNLTKQYLKPKSKCSSTSESVQQNICNKTQGLPRHVSQPPCGPIAEKGVDLKARATCTPKVTCPEVKTPTLSDFFPIDARNKELNACIEKYMKIDPSRVTEHCSKLSNVTLSMTEKCLRSGMTEKYFETVKKPQQKCLPVQFGEIKTRPPLISPRGRQLMGRWAPSAAVYMATAALCTVYVTEWKAVLRHVPLYYHLNEDESRS